ncbi:HTH_Tnp_Tc3_2 domain-containing protein [Trichonephila clavipes]|nr:HTH_Tnp_Tc3_2 domain-containing protein [Trichonephila clavipes]
MAGYLDLSQFKRGVIVGVREMGHSVSEVEMKFGFSSSNREYRESCKTSNQRHRCGQKKIIKEGSDDQLEEDNTLLHGDTRPHAAFGTSQKLAETLKSLVVKLEDAPYYTRTAMAGSDVVQSGRPIFDDFFQHLWPYIGNNTANVVFQMVKRLWLIHIDQ